MSKAKLFLASVLLVFAVGVIAAASASAETEKPEFVIETKGGVKEGSTEKIVEESATDVTALKLEAEGEPTIECTKDKVVGDVITDDSADETIKALDFEGCADKSEAACSVPKGDIDTTELEVELEPAKTEKDTVEKFKPKTGEEIANFKLEGTGCGEKNELKIDGDFISKEEDHEAKAETELPVNVEVTSASKELEYGDQLHPARFVLGLRFHAPIPWGLCRHPHLLSLCPFS